MTGMNIIACASCNWRFMTWNAAPTVCPHCRSEAISTIEDDKIFHFEKVLPFSVDVSEFRTRVQTFGRRIPFKPVDLKPENLSKRFERLFLPKYLVDADVQAVWQAEMGFDYEVVSHQEIYSGSTWKTVEKKEIRQNWSPRMGNLERTYHNISAPALEDDGELSDRLGGFSLSASEPLFSEMVEKSEHWVRLPDRDREDSWKDTISEFQNRASAECRLAAGADHVKSFNWQPSFAEENWTLLLLPIYSSYYLDDEKRMRKVLVNGQTGTVFGDLYASEARAKKLALILLFIALVLFGGSVVMGLISPLLPFLGIGAVLFFVLSAASGIAAAFPVYIARKFNRGQMKN